MDKVAEAKGVGAHEVLDDFRATLELKHTDRDSYTAIKFYEEFLKDAFDRDRIMEKVEVYGVNLIAGYALLSLMKTIIFELI